MDGYEPQYPLYDREQPGPENTVWRNTDEAAEQMKEWGVISDKDSVVSGYDYIGIFGSGA